MPKPTFDKIRDRWQVIIPGTATEPRKRRYFSTREEAAEFAQSVRGLRDPSMVDFMRLEPQDRSRLLRCVTVAGSVAAVEEAVARMAAAKPKLEKKLAEAAKECVQAKEQAGRSWQYVENLEVALKHFTGSQGGAVSAVTSGDVETWLAKGNWSPQTKQTYLRRLDTFFAFAQARGWCVSNPTHAVEKLSVSAGRITVLSVADCRRLLTTCRKVDPALLPYFAIGLFAGIRPDELKRLQPHNVKDGWIEVEGAKSKTRRRRLVEIHPTLKAWLGVPGGKIGWMNWRRRWRAVREAVPVVGEFGPLQPISWSSDVMRHSFCSYAYPIKGAHWTSMHAGHSEQMLFTHYRELVTEAEAQAFWALTPS